MYKIFLLIACYLATPYVYAAVNDESKHRGRINSAYRVSTIVPQATSVNKSDETSSSPLDFRNKKNTTTDDGPTKKKNKKDNRKSSEKDTKTDSPHRIHKEDEDLETITLKRQTPERVRPTNTKAHLILHGNAEINVPLQVSDINNPKSTPTTSLEEALPSQ